MKMMMMMMMMITITFMLTKHPLTMGMNLMIQTILISMTMNMMTNSAWFSFILTIIMLGGMMVLFMYMASITSNEKMKPSIKMTMMIMMMPIMMMMMKPWIKKMNMMETPQEMSMTKMFNMNNNSMTLFMMTYLLITMIVVNYILNTKEGPMRKKK